MTIVQIDGLSLNNYGNWAAAAQTAVPNATAQAVKDGAVVTNVKASDQNSNIKDTAEKNKGGNSEKAQIAIENTILKFKVHEQTGDIMIQVVDNSTGNVVREIPPEKILDSIAEIWKNSGINVDKKA